MSRLRIWGLTLAWAVLIVALTVSPAPSLPLSPPVPGIDKLVHAALFAVLTWLALQARERDRALRMPLWMLVTAIAVFAGTDEWLQQFAPGRAADFLDWMADLAGSLVAVWLYRSAPRRREMMS